MLAERVDDCRVRVGHQEHVRLLDLLETTDGRAVKTVAILEGGLGQLVGRYGEVLHQPRQVTEADVDDVDSLILDQRQDLLGRSPREGQGRFPFLVLSAVEKSVGHDRGSPRWHGHVAGTLLLCELCVNVAGRPPLNASRHPTRDLSCHIEGKLATWDKIGATAAP